jgi:methionyl-tRNA formyltransferase
MHIVLACATLRGVAFARKLAELAPEARLTLFSFREEPHEPPYLETLRAFADETGAQFYEARQLGSARWREFWAQQPIDLMFLVSWRYLIPREVYQKPRLGTFVFHDSLLPRYRGFAPTVWAIINGEDHTGVTLFEIAEGMDAGDIVAQERIPIAPDDTIADVLPRVTACYLNLLELNLPLLLGGNAPRTRQDHSLATFTCKRLVEDNRIDWSLPTSTVYNLIRASVAPYPGALTSWRGKHVRIWGATRLPPNYPHYVGRIPGRVVEARPGQGVVVLTGDGALFITTAQIEDAPPATADQLFGSVTDTLGR